MTVIFQMFIFQKKKKQNAYKTNKNTFFYFLEPDKVWPYSYVFPSRMKNQGYVVLL